MAGSLFSTNQNGQAAYAAPQAPHKPLVCLRVSSCPLVSSPFVCFNGSSAFWTGTSYQRRLTMSKYIRTNKASEQPMPIKATSGSPNSMGG